MYLNIIKGIAIVLMLWGHCIQFASLDAFDYFENGVFKVIYSFHMPLFMLVSGYLFYFSYNKRSLPKLLNHRVIGMLHPIVVQNILAYFACMAPGILIDAWQGRSLMPYLKRSLEGNWISSITGLWFLWSVLTSSLIVGTIFKSINRPVYRSLGLMVGAALLAFFPNATLCFFMYPFFILGFLFAHQKTHFQWFLQRLRYIWPAMGIVFAIMLLFYKRKHFIYTTGFWENDYTLLSNIRIHVYRWSIGLVGSIFVLSGVQWLLKLQKWKPFSSFFGYLAEIGAKSLQFYCLSGIIFASFMPSFYACLEKIYGKHLIVENMLIYNWIATPVNTFVITVVLLWLIRKIEKLGCSIVLFGR